METCFIRDNLGEKQEVITGLKVGDELFCHSTERSKTGVGLWSTERYDSFIQGKTYKVNSLYRWDGILVAYVTDEDGCSCWAKPKTFKKL